MSAKRGSSIKVALIIFKLILLIIAIIRFSANSPFAPEREVEKPQVYIDLKNRDYMAVRKGIESGNYDVNARYYNDLTMLQTAVDSNDVEMVRLILEYKPSLDVPPVSPVSSLSPLHLAVYSVENIEIMKLLLDYGADPDNIIDRLGGPPLKHAIFGDRIDMVQLLLDYGADVNSDYDEGGLVNYIVISPNGEDDIETLDLLLSYGLVIEDLKPAVQEAMARNKLGLAQHLQKD